MTRAQKTTLSLTLTWYQKREKSRNYWIALMRRCTGRRWRKDAGPLHARCIEKLLRPKEDPSDFEGDILIMFTYDEYPDDTIKMRYKVDGYFEEDGSPEICDYQIFWFDHEEHDNPMDYSAFHEFYAAAETAAGF